MRFLLAALSAALLACAVAGPAHALYNEPMIGTRDGHVTVTGNSLVLNDTEGSIDLRSMFNHLVSLQAQVDSLEARNSALEAQTSTLEARNSALESQLDNQIVHTREDLDYLLEFASNASEVLPPAAPTLVLDIFPNDTRDLGDIITEHFQAGTVDLYVYLHPSNDSDHVYHWDHLVVQPQGTTLYIRGVGSQHTGISATGEAGRRQDLERCPTTILMDDVHVMDRPGSGYDGWVTYYRLIMKPHSRAHIQGVTIREVIDHITPETRVYEHGLITVRGPFSSIIIRDARVEFGQKAFINSHSAGRTFVTLGHVRLVGVDVAGGEEIYPVTSSRGQSWNGNICELAVTGGTIEAGVVYHPEVTTGYFQLHYLT